MLSLLLRPRPSRLLGHDAVNHQGAVGGVQADEDLERIGIPTRGKITKNGSAFESGLFQGSGCPDRRPNILSLLPQDKDSFPGPYGNSTKERLWREPQPEHSLGYGSQSSASDSRSGIEKGVVHKKLGLLGDEVRVKNKGGELGCCKVAQQPRSGTTR